MLLPGPDGPSSTDVPPGTDNITGAAESIGTKEVTDATGTEEGPPPTGTNGSLRTSTNEAPSTDNVPCTDRSPGTDSTAGTRTPNGPNGPTSVVVPGVTSTPMSSFS